MDQEYTVVSKGKRRRSRKKVHPIVVENAHYDERADSVSSNISSSSSLKSPTDERNSYYNFGNPEVIYKCVQERWKNDIEYANAMRTSRELTAHPPGLPSPVKFFENSKSARFFQIAQQHSDEYIPVPSMQPYMVPLFPDKEFYNAHGFIPSQFLSLNQ